MAAKKRLGRGLDSLLSAGRDSVPAESKDWHLRQIPVERIRRGQYQPRREFDESALAELAASIRRQGVVQPVVVRPRDNGDYELIAGERRWRAAQLAQQERIPAVIRELSDEDAAALAIIENIQRENLNPLEEAQGLRRLLDDFGFTHKEVAEAVGRSRSGVSNMLRLLELTEPVREMLAEGSIEMGHARALLPLGPEDQQALAKKIASRGYSVREIERLVREQLEGKAAEAAKEAPKDPNIARLEEQLSQRIGAGIDIRHRKTGKGQLVISYASLDELDGIIDRIR